MNAKRILLLAILSVLSVLPASMTLADDDLLAAIRRETAKYQQVQTAVAEGYAPQFGCVSHAEHGAMGIHHINGTLFEEPSIDPLRPEAVMYEPQPDGSLQAVGIEYVVLQDAWHKAGNQDPPVLMGQTFNLTTNFFDVPPFYALHVWLWKENPNGLFASYNPSVSCRATDVPQSLPNTGDSPGFALPLWLMLATVSLATAGWLFRRHARRA